MTEHEIDSSIVETIQRMFFDQVVDPEIESRMFDIGNAVNQLVEYRKQHDTRKIGDHQSDRHRESLVVEYSPCDTAHEYQRHKYGDCRQCGTQHRGDHFAGPHVTSLFQRIPFRPVLHDILRHNDRTVDHHTQCQDQSGKGNDVQRHLEHIEEKEADNQTDHHTQADHCRTLDIPQKQDSHYTYKYKAERQVLFQV